MRERLCERGCGVVWSRIVGGRSGRSLSVDLCAHRREGSWIGEERRGRGLGLERRGERRGFLGARETESERKEKRREERGLGFFGMCSVGCRYCVDGMFLDKCVCIRLICIQMFIYVHVSYMCMCVCVCRHGYTS